MAVVYAVCLQKDYPNASNAIKVSVGNIVKKNARINVVAMVNVTRQESANVPKDLLAPHVCLRRVLDNALGMGYAKSQVFVNVQMDTQAMHAMYFTGDVKRTATIMAHVLKTKMGSIGVSATPIGRVNYAM
jgi:hypothetical protein